MNSKTEISNLKLSEKNKAGFLMNNGILLNMMFQFLNAYKNNSNRQLSFKRKVRNTEVETEIISDIRKLKAGIRGNYAKIRRINADINKNFVSPVKITAGFHKTTDDLNASMDDLNVSTEDMNVSTEDMNVSTEDMNVSTEDMNVSTEDMNVSTDDMNVSTEDMNVSTEDMNVSTEDMNVSTEDMNVSMKNIANLKSEILKLRLEIYNSGIFLRKLKNRLKNVRKRRIKESFERIYVNADSYMHYSNNVIFEITQTGSYAEIIIITFACKKVISVVILMLHSYRKHPLIYAFYKESLKSFDGVIERYCGVPP